MKYLCALLFCSIFMLSCDNYEGTGDVEHTDKDTAAVRESPYSTPGSTDDAQPNY